MRKILLSAMFLVFYSCTPAVKNQEHSLTYFDLKGYVEKEAIRLTKINPLITKTVIVKDSAETKKIKIGDWAKELSIFSDADINRSAWKGVFTVKKNAEKEVYTSNDEKVAVKELTVLKKNSQIYGIQILIKNTNLLYNSGDTLTYYPDSLYQVKKKQHIKLLSEKNYSITGEFN